MNNRTLAECQDRRWARVLPGQKRRSPMPWLIVLLAALLLALLIGIA